jgi:LysR family nitrogen assimilation transcriptional regulator
MNLNQLRYFLRVAEAGSFSQAATILGVAQPALSRQIRGLEDEMMQALFVRDGRGVRLTEAGSCLAGHAAKIIQQVGDATHAVQELRDAPVGAVSIGMPTTPAKIVIVPIVNEFRRRFPKATIRVTEGLSTYLLEFLTAGRIDAALLYDMNPSAALEIIPVLIEPLFLISSKPVVATGKQISADLLARCPLILPARPNAIRALVERRLAQGGRRPNIVLEIDAIAATLELVAAGHGHTILSKNALSAWRPTTRNFVATPVRPRLKAELSMVVSTRGRLTPLQKATLTMVRQITRRMLV